MLEYDFNELDNDFITIWSKYILSPSNGAPCGLEELASLGQINAIQSVLLFDDDELHTKNVTKKVMDQIEYLEDKNYEANFNEELIIQNAMRRVRDTDNIYLIFNGLVRENLSNREHLDMVLHKHQMAYLASNNPLILQRFYEIKKGNFKFIAKLTVKSLGEELRQLYYANTGNSANAFAYAKNLYFFGDKDGKSKGKIILNNLSQRKFSAKLQEEIDKTNITEKTTRGQSNSIFKKILENFGKEKAKSREEEIGFIDAVCEKRDQERSIEPEQISVFDIND